MAIRCVNLILWLQIHLTDVFYWYLIPSNEKFEIQKFWVKWKILHVTSSLREKKFWKCPMTLILFRGHRGHQLDSQEYFHHVVTTCSLCPARAPKTVWIFTKNRHLSLISNFLALFLRLTHDLFSLDCFLHCYTLCYFGTEMNTLRFDVQL